MKKILPLNQLLNKPYTSYEKFHKKTKLYAQKAITDSKYWPKEWKKVYFKSYPRLEELMLPSPIPNIRSSLHEALVTRHSQRKFSNKPLSKEQIAHILYYSAGLRRATKNDISNRFYPSGGARYPLEVYLFTPNCEIPQGIFHYYVKSHSLEKLSSLSMQTIKTSFIYPWAETASCILIITARFNRTTVKYGDRGYRLVLIEAGHLGQNIYLTSAATNISCCALDGYLDDTINDLLGIDGVNETVVYTFALGNPYENEL